MDDNEEKIQQLLFMNKNLRHSNIELSEEITCLENSFSIISHENEQLRQKLHHLKASFGSAIQGMLILYFEKTLLAK